MTQNDPKTEDFQEMIPMVTVETKGGAYSYISPKRVRKEVAVIVAPPPPPEHPDDEEDTRRTREFAPAVVRSLLASRDQAAPAKPEAYRDPELCSCAKMMTALASKVVMVVWNGPVTLSPAIMREEMLLSGDYRLDSIERAYDGKPWAFRHCPFEGELIDDQVEVLPQVDNMTCCGTMHQAVLHGRVELPEPDRHDRMSAKFVDPGNAALIFSRCPWCATEIIDLVLARYKRHRGL